MYFVTMIDKKTSYKHPYENKRVKYIFLCPTKEQAGIVALNARKKGTMSYVRIATMYPYATQKDIDNVMVVRTIQDSPDWYVKEKDYD